MFRSHSEEAAHESEQEVKTLITDGFYNGARRSMMATVRMALEAARRLR